ncbi:nuclear transport factor 2 family protein [Paraburkholderia sp. JHI2823]|uniref:nuclear transport factor 2 family protein n=1 Tax=Paraburkholderia sp. JHI2823 TaxID=3112960 RepID=UPI003175C53B
MEHQKIIEACEKAFTGFERNDKTHLVALLADDLEFEFSDSLPYGGTYHGKAEFLAFWKHVYQKWEYFNYDARAILEAGDFIIVPVVARAKAYNGFSMQNEHLFLFEVRDGQIVRGRLYADTARGRDILEDRAPKRYPKLIVD